MEPVSTQKIPPERTCEATEYIHNNFCKYQLDVKLRAATLVGRERVEETSVLNQDRYTFRGQLCSEEMQAIHEQMFINKTIDCQPVTKKATFEVVVSQDENEVREENFEDRLPDGGWGWIVVFGAAIILMLVDILSQCFGVIFSSFLLELETPSIVTSWIFNLFGFAWCATGPFLGALTTAYGWRGLTVTGSFLLFFATIFSAFITAAWPLFFTYSLVSGAAGGIVSSISYVAVPHYFNKRRGLANGILMAFDCSGQLLGPPLLEILQQEFTYQGATLILGGIVLNSCVGALVFHPVEWHLKSQVLQKSKDKQNKLQTPLASTADDKNQQETLFNIFTRLHRSIASDLRILKSARALTIAISASLIMNCYLNFIAFVPFTMQESGHTLKEVVACVSISAFCNIITRVVMATLSDYPWFDYRISMMIASVLISGTMFGFVVFQNFTVLKVIMGLWGCGAGMFMSIFNLVMVHYMGLDKLTQTLGATMLCMAIAYLIIGPLAGLLGDLTYGYTASTWFLASMVFISFLLWITMPLAVAYDKRKKEDDDDGNLKQKIPDSLDSISR